MWFSIPAKPAFEISPVVCYGAIFAIMCPPKYAIGGKVFPVIDCDSMNASFSWFLFECINPRLQSCKRHRATNAKGEDSLLKLGPAKHAIRLDAMLQCFVENALCDFLFLTHRARQDVCLEL